VAKDYAEAGKWYRKAAEAGVTSAEYNLGVMYDLGQGVERNYPEALKWYRKAAGQGYAGAICNIGILYYNAQGVERDMAQSYAWFSLCEQAGDARGGQLRRVVEERIKPAELEKGKEIAAGWHPTGPARQTAAERLFVRMEPKTEPAAAQAGTAPAVTPPAPAPAPQPVPQRGAPAAIPATSLQPEPDTKPAVAQAAAGTPAGTAPAGTAPAAAPPGPAPAPAAQPPRAPAAVPTAALQPAAAVQSYWAGVDRIVAVGDVFGDFEQFFTVLESANLIDGNGDWVGGAAHLVQTGNIVDFGPDSRKIMDLLMRLEKQSAAAGGGVHCLIGNHEAMDVYGDLRFVSPGEFGAFRPQDLESAAPVPKPGEISGFAEQRAAFAPGGIYGRWIAGHNAVVKIDNSLFVHAGIGPKYANGDMGRVNQAVRRELTRLDELHGGVVTDPQGPLLFTGLAKGDEAEMAPLVDRVLNAYGVQRIVVGHTYADGAVTPRFGGKVILVNVGLPRVYDNAGKLACLVIEGGHPYALHRGQRLELPKDEGVDMQRYLREAAALDPQPSPLAARIARLANRPRP
jgi:hypothetical protein